MNKKALCKVLDDIFSPLGYIRTKDRWCLENSDISKEIWLQKSSYGDYFYLNYYFIITSLIPQKGWLPVADEGFGAGCRSDQIQQLDALLDLSNDMPDDKKETDLHTAIKSYMILRLNSINSEVDILNWYRVTKRPMSIWLKEHYSTLE